jgi:hypothetical protein
MISPPYRGLKWCMGTDNPPPPDVHVDARAAPADLATLDALARICLIAQRQGLTVRVDNVSRELRELAGFAGLDDVLPLRG